MSTLIISAIGFLGIGGLIALALFLSYRSGKQHVINASNEKAKEVANEQAQIAINRPAKSDVINSMRNGNF